MYLRRVLLVVSVILSTTPPCNFANPGLNRHNSDVNHNITSKLVRNSNNQHMAGLDNGLTLGWCHAISRTNVFTIPRDWGLSAAQQTKMLQANRTGKFACAGKVTGLGPTSRRWSRIPVDCHKYYWPDSCVLWLLLSLVPSDIWIYIHATYMAHLVMIEARSKET